jgi:PLP dependent protein
MSKTIATSATDRLCDVQVRIAKSAALARRPASAITLIAISKTYAASAIQPLIDAGQRHFGENRVQEAQEKWPALITGYPDIVLHLVGQLQSNKAADAVAVFDVIHSVDRPSLATALAKAMHTSGKRPDCYIQVNIGDEPQKGGCAVRDLLALIDQCSSLNLPIIGLMCVPPADIEPAPFFALLAKLANDYGLPARSMGMSGDFETAVQLGATCVRVGSALFGPRG